MIIKVSLLLTWFVLGWAQGKGKGNPGPPPVDYYESCRHYYDEDSANPDPGNNQNLFDDANCPRPNSNGYPTSLTVAYIELKPYIYADGDDSNPKGILADFVRDFIGKACMYAQSDTITWTKYSFDTVEELQQYCRANPDNCHVMIPNMGVANVDGGNGIVNGNYFAAFFRTGGDAFITVQGETWRKSLKTFGRSFFNAWPFMAICLICAFLSGTVLWLLDTWSNRQEFPRSFFPGIYQGFWWSFVSMTTVGYGDKSPRSFCARLFSIFWIVVGISMISILTSIMSSALTDSTVIAPIEVDGLTVGYLPGSGSALPLINDRNGVPKLAKDVIELENWLARGLIIGFVMEVNILKTHWKNRFSKLPGIKYVLQELVINQGKRKFGMSFYEPAGTPAAVYWKVCMEAYMLSNVHSIDSMERYYRGPYMDLFDSSLFLPSDPEALSLFDPKSEFFTALMWMFISIIIAVIVAGMIYELFRLLFFGKNPISISDRLGLSRNAGFTGSGDAAGGKTNDSPDKTKQTKEERQMQELVEKTIRKTETKMQDTESNVKNEIREMVRTLRRQMAERQRAGDNDYGL